jgi:hypothetical protein
VKGERGKESHQAKDVLTKSGNLEETRLRRKGELKRESGSERADEE